MESQPPGKMNLVDSFIRNPRPLYFVVFFSGGSRQIKPIYGARWLSIPLWPTPPLVPGHECVASSVTRLDSDISWVSAILDASPASSAGGHRADRERGAGAAGRSEVPREVLPEAPQEREGRRPDSCEMRPS